MNTNETESLRQLYSTWSTPDLLSAVQARSAEYAPEAIALMRGELCARKVAVSANMPTPSESRRDAPFIIATVAASPLVALVLAFAVMWALYPFLPATEALANFFFLVVILGAVVTSTWLPTPFLAAAFVAHAYALRRMQKTRFKVRVVYAYLILSIVYACYYLWWHMTGQRLTMP